MNCPACGNVLSERTVDGIVVDVCDVGCGGIWFDNHELVKFDEPHEGGESLLEVGGEPAVPVDHGARRGCPQCDDQVMRRFFFSAKREVEVDECPACGGVWLDCGELAGIRSQFSTEAERQEAAEAYFQDVFGEELSKMKEESQERLRTTRRIARVFRFICPSYYIPGKQSWGAF